MITSGLSVLATSATQSSKKSGLAPVRPLHVLFKVMFHGFLALGVEFYLGSGSKISVKSKRPDTGLVFKL